MILLSKRISFSVDASSAWKSIQGKQAGNDVSIEVLHKTNDCAFGVFLITVFERDSARARVMVGTRYKICYKLCI